MLIGLIVALSKCCNLDYLGWLLCLTTRLVVYCSSGGGRAAEEIGSDDVSYHDIGIKKLGFKEPVHHIVRDQDDNIHEYGG